MALKGHQFAIGLVANKRVQLKVNKENESSHMFRPSNHKDTLLISTGYSMAFEI